MFMIGESKASLYAASSGNRSVFFMDRSTRVTKLKNTRDTAQKVNVMTACNATEMLF